MNNNWQQRTELLLGKDSIEKLKNSHLLIVGLGGVGGMAAEMLCRAGVGKLTIVDADTIDITNLNRQIACNSKNIGCNKVDEIYKRLKDINPEINLIPIKDYLIGDKMTSLLEKKYDYILDAIDTLTPKIELLKIAYESKHRIISAMGAAGRRDPSMIEVKDIETSYNCKLAKLVRKRLHRIGINKGIKVVFSSEIIPKDAFVKTDGLQHKRSTVGAISYLPPMFGCFMASVVINDIINE